MDDQRPRRFKLEHLRRLQAIRVLQERHLPLDAIEATLAGATPAELARLATGKVPATVDPTPVVSRSPEPVATVDRVTRHALAPGLELLVSDHATPEVRALAERLLREAAPPRRRGHHDHRASLQVWRRGSVAGRRGRRRGARRVRAGARPPALLQRGEGRGGGGVHLPAARRRDAHGHRDDLRRAAHGGRREGARRGVSGLRRRPRGGPRRGAARPGAARRLYRLRGQPAARRGDADRITPPRAAEVGYGLRLDLVFDLGRAVTVASPSHAITALTEGSRVRVRFAQAEVALDRDVVLMAVEAAIAAGAYPTLAAMAGDAARVRAWVLA